MNKIEDWKEKMETIRLFYQEIDFIQDKYRISDKQLLQFVSKTHYGKDMIPASVFSGKKLSSFEAIVKYLRENCNLNFREIGDLLHRSKFTIASSYRSAQVKDSEKFDIVFSEYVIPTIYIANRKYSVLESIVLYLKQEYKLRFVEIAKILNLNPRTIWTVYSRANRKQI